MQILDVLKQSYAAKSLDESQANLTNLYLVESQEQSQGMERNKVALYPTPGATLQISGLAGPIRALYEHNGIAFAVAGNTLVAISSTNVVTSLGTLLTSTGTVKIASIQDYLCMIDGTYGYYFQLSTQTFSQITDVNFPSTAIDITAQDEFFIVALGASNMMQCCAIADPTTWPALNFFSATGNSNNIVGIKCNHRELWVLCNDSTEVDYNAGTSPVPFAPIQGVFIEYGLSARDSLAAADNTLFFLGKYTTGGHVVIRMNGYTPEIISDRAVAYQISTYSVVSDAIAFCYQQEGHEFYVITFPTAGTTFTYDISTGQWNNRNSIMSGSAGKLPYYYYTFVYNTPFVGDSTAGKIYSLDMTNYTDNNSAITRSWTSPNLYQNGQRWSISRLQVDFETGVGSNEQFTLAVSKDGGRTFPLTYTANIPLGGGRIYFPRLGHSWVFTFRITSTAACRFIILNILANAAVRDN